MPDESVFSPAPSEPPMPEAHRGEFILYGSDPRARWTPCRFVFSPSWHPNYLHMVRAELPPYPLTHLDSAGALHEGSLPPTSGEVMVVPRLASIVGNPRPATIVVPPDALDRIGIRVAIRGRHCDCDILSPAGRRELRENARVAPELARDVANWISALGSTGDPLPPRLDASLVVETEIDRLDCERQPFGLPAGVTPDGLARWQAMQRFRTEMWREWTQSDCERLLHDLNRGPDSSCPDADRMDGRDAVFRFIAQSVAGKERHAVQYNCMSFKPLTKAGDKGVACAQLGGADTSLDEIEEGARQLGWRRIDDAWAVKAMASFRERLDDILHGFGAETRLLTRARCKETEPPAAGTDMLLVASGNEVHACAWPTWQRQDSLVTVRKGALPRVFRMVAAREIPSMEDVQELSAHVHARRQEARHESEAETAPLASPAM